MPGRLCQYVEDNQQYIRQGKKSNPPSTIIYNSVEITEPTQICNIFNDYFINIGQNLSNNIQSNNINPLNYLGDRCLNSFSSTPTTPLEIFNLIKKFKNKKTSINNIPIAIIKKISHIISPLLAQLFNESIDTGIFPEKLKTGRVIPLHKGGASNNISNFRPITILSVYSKIFEKLVHKRLVSFISQNNLIKLNQFGFQQNKNTSDAILEFLENIDDSFNSNKHYLAIFL